MPIAFDISLDDGKLFLILQTNRQELVPVKNDVFASVEAGRIRFERNASGKVTTLVLGEEKLRRKG